MTRYVAEAMASPLGRLTLVAANGQVNGVFFADHGRAPVLPGVADIAALDGLGQAEERADARALAAARTALERYFAGEDPGGWEVPAGIGTEFQRRIWDALVSVGRGQVVSYGELVASIGRPSAVRAVGAAVGANPLSILVPCHRVLGAGATLTGYAGGLDRKRWLLEHEGIRFRA